MNFVAISVITINYNNLIGLRNTITSVISQEYNKIQYIIIDGGSTDGSAEFIAGVADKLYYWVSEKDNGIYDAMNKGIKFSQGEYLLFLNSGDCFSDNKVLHRFQENIISNSDTDIFYGNIYFVNELGNLGKHLWTHPSDITLDFLEYENINHQASLIKSSLFKELGVYPENYKLASDFWFFLQCFLHDKVFTHIPLPLIDYDMTGSSNVSKDIYLKEKRDIWNDLVPLFVQRILKDNKKLTIKNEQYKHIISYKLVNYAIRLNNLYQKFKKN